ncbi:MAG: amidohydrolase family protein, partial [Candidatus Heimdallarchaeota archaeon]|nr:amidohydrolase family protein [Candidatus Heimdallarchaeota archaeon]MCK5145100.1 amidohydrolase family protein [Candidatus Heimdallarchaeota archaeon]
KLVKLAQEFPKANYIIAHSMGLETIAKKGKRLKNIYFDISTYFIISEKRIRFAMEKFGEDKVLLGSDSPLGYRNLELNIEKIRKMDLTEKQKSKILGENIAKLLNL